MRVGILGGGQLGRMIALAGYPLGVRCTVLDPAAESSCRPGAARTSAASSTTFRRSTNWRKASDVVTFEFENVPVETARWLAERVPVFPPPRALEVSQERLAEKQFFASLGIPTPPFAAVDSRARVRRRDPRHRPAGGAEDAPVRLRRQGAGGAAHAGRLRSRVGEARRPPAHPRRVRAVRPRTLDHRRPRSRRAGRRRTRSSRTSTATASCTARVAPAGEHRRGTDRAGRGVRVARADGAGLRRGADDRVVPGRPAAAGERDGPAGPQLGALDDRGGDHDASSRTTCGRCAGCRSAAATRSGYSAMYNFIGSVPPAAEVLANPDAKLHAYGKSTAPGRKVGHVTLRAGSAEELAEKSGPGWDRAVRKEKAVCSQRDAITG